MGELEGRSRRGVTLRRDDLPGVLHSPCELDRLKERPVPALATQEDYPLAERAARIVTYTADALTYSPSPPQYYGMVDFDGGGRMMIEFTDVQAADVEVGKTMQMSFRIKSVDERRDFTKYFWKGVPPMGRLSTAPT